MVTNQAKTPLIWKPLKKVRTKPAWKIVNDYLYYMEILSTIQKKLQQVKPDLMSKYHISTIGLFGSVVRKDFTSESDIDIVVDFSRPIGVEFIDLANEIELVLNRRVDLVSRAGIKPGYLCTIESEIVYV